MNDTIPSAPTPPPLTTPNLIRAASWLLWTLGLPAAAILSLIPLYLNPLGDDQGYFLYCAGRLVKGEPVFFGFNFPFTYYFHAPVAWASSLTGVPATLIFELYVLALVAISLALSLRILRYSLDGGLPLAACAIVLTVLLVAYPIHTLIRNDFGEREHILLICTAPYLLLAASRARNHSPGLALSTTVGAFAAVGLAQKPTFVVVWCLVELCLVLQGRGWPWKRAESLWIAGFLVVYAIALGTIFSNFLMMTRWSAHAYLAWGSPFTDLLLAAIGALVMLVAVPLLDGPRSRFSLAPIAAGILGFLISAFVQRTDSFYHFYPAYAAAFLMLCLAGFTSVDGALEDSIAPARQNGAYPIIWACLALSGTALLLTFVLWERGLFPWFLPYEASLAVVAALELLAVAFRALGPVSNNGRHVPVTAARLAGFGLMAAAAGLAIRSLSGMEPPQLDNALLLTILGFAIVGRLGNLSKQATVRAAGALIAILLTSSAQNAEMTLGHQSDLLSSPESRLARIVSDFAPHRHIYVFSTSPSPAFPLANTVGASLGWRFVTVNYLPGLYSNRFDGVQYRYRSPAERGRIERFVVQGVVQDFQALKPELVIAGGPGTQFGFGNHPFDFVGYFAHDPGFNQIWQHYRPLHIDTWLDALGYQIYERSS